MNIHIDDIDIESRFDVFSAIYEKDDTQSNVFDIFFQIEGRTHLYSTLEKAVYQIIRRMEQKSLLVVNLDHVSKKTDAIEHLNRLRRKNPFCGIVILSASFSENDYSQERLSIADVSLKLPFTNDLFPPKVLLSLSRNNAAWRARLAEIYSAEKICADPVGATCPVDLPPHLHLNPPN